MRLIDADTLVKDLSYLYTKNHIPVDMRAKEILTTIMEQPTAYSVEKVVEELKSDKRHTFDGCINKRYAIEIVKQGGVADDVCEWKLTKPRTFMPYKTSCGNDDLYDSSVLLKEDKGGGVMERLTTRLSDGNYIPKALCTIARDGEVDDVDGCNECCDSCNGECSVCAIQKCFNKLAEYEDAEELKAQRQNPHGYSKEDIELNRKAAYNKAIDDFVQKVKEHQYVLSDVINSKDYGMFTVGIEQIAEQLKAGGNDENT